MQDLIKHGFPQHQIDEVILRFAKTRSDATPDTLIAYLNLLPLQSVSLPLSGPSLPPAGVPSLAEIGIIKDDVSTDCTALHRMMRLLALPQAYQLTVDNRIQCYMDVLRANDVYKRCFTDAATREGLVCVQLNKSMAMCIEHDGELVPLTAELEKERLSDEERGQLHRVHNSCEVQFKLMQTSHSILNSLPPLLDPDAVRLTTAVANNIFEQASDIYQVYNSGPINENPFPKLPGYDIFVTPYDGSTEPRDKARAEYGRRRCRLRDDHFAKVAQGVESGEDGSEAGEAEDGDGDGGSATEPSEAENKSCADEK